jgi:hypothetical protein
MIKWNEPCERHDFSQVISFEHLKHELAFVLFIEDFYSVDYSTTTRRQESSRVVCKARPRRLFGYTIAPPIFQLKNYITGEWRGWGIFYLLKVGWWTLILKSEDVPRGRKRDVEME